MAKHRTKRTTKRRTKHRTPRAGVGAPEVLDVFITNDSK